MRRWMRGGSNYCSEASYVYRTALPKGPRQSTSSNNGNQNGPTVICTSMNTWCAHLAQWLPVKRIKRWFPSRWTAICPVPRKIHRIELKRRLRLCGSEQSTGYWRVCENTPNLTLSHPIPLSIFVIQSAVHNTYSRSYNTSDTKSHVKPSAQTYQNDNWKLGPRGLFSFLVGRFGGSYIDFAKVPKNSVLLWPFLSDAEDKQ